MRHSVWKVCLESIFNEYYSFYFPHIFIFFQRESRGMWHLIWKVFPVHIHFIIFLHEKVHLVWKVCSIHWFWGMCIKCSIQWIMMTWTFEGAKIYNILSLDNDNWRPLSRSNICLLRPIIYENFWWDKLWTLGISEKIIWDILGNFLLHLPLLKFYYLMVKFQLILTLGFSLLENQHKPAWKKFVIYLKYET